jgi:ferredoxin
MKILWTLKHLFPTDDAHFKRVMGDSFPIPRRIRSFYNKNNQNNKIQDSHKSCPTTAILEHDNLVGTKTDINKNIHYQGKTENPSDVIINPFTNSPDTPKNSFYKIPKT